MADEQRTQEFTLSNRLYTLAKTMIVLYRILLLLMMAQVSSAQYTTVWVQTECDSPVTGYSRMEDILVDDAGRVIVTGTIDTALGIGPAYMAYDSLGNLLWKKSQNGLNFYFSYRLLENPSGSFVFGGEYEDNTGTNNMIYTELDPTGATLTNVIYNAPGNNTGDDLDDMAMDSRGTIYLSGHIQNNSNFYAAIIRYDSAGVYRWMSYHPLLSGWNSSTGRCIETVGDTGVYQLIFNATGYGALTYCDSSGNYQWQKTLPISLAEYHTQLIVDKDGNAIVGGDMGQNGGIMKLNGAGDSLWSAVVSYPGLSGILTTVINLQTDAAGNIYVLATNGGNPAYSIVAAFNSSGSQLWADTLRGYFTLYTINREFFHLEDGILTIGTNRGTPWLYRYTTSGQRITDAALVVPGITAPEISAIDYHNGDLYITGTGYAGFNVRQGYTARLTGLTTGITEIQEYKTLQLYPNPADHLLNIGSLPNTASALSMFDIAGRCVLQQNVSADQPQVNIEHLKEGIYVIKVESGDGLFTGKVVVGK
mgnify:FL=1